MYTFVYLWGVSTQDSSAKLSTFFISFYVYGCLTCMQVCAPQVPGTQEGQKRAPGPRNQSYFIHELARPWWALSRGTEKWLFSQGYTVT